MAAVLIEPNGNRQTVNYVEGDEETVLRERDAEGPVVNLHVRDDEGVDFILWMALEPSQPMNTYARQAIVNLTALHIMCFGPVLLTQLDGDMAVELAGG